MRSNVMLAVWLVVTKARTTYVVPATMIRPDHVVMMNSHFPSFLHGPHGKLKPAAS